MRETYFLWAFTQKPTSEGEGHRIITTRGRTPNEAQTYAEHFFKNTKGVYCINALPVDAAKRYSAAHVGYDWLHTPPLWLQLDTV